jgi:hypothetical protein
MNEFEPVVPEGRELCLFIVNFFAVTNCTNNDFLLRYLVDHFVIAHSKRLKFT